MTPELIDLILRFGAGGILALLALLLLRDRGREAEGWIGMAVIVCSTAFLITSSNPFYREGTPDLLLRQVAALTPVTLWAALLGPGQVRRSFIILLIAIAFAALGAGRAGFKVGYELERALALIHGLWALALLGHGVLCVNGWRARFDFPRSLFALLAAGYGAVVAFVDPIRRAFDLPLAIEMLASGATFLFVLGVAFFALALPATSKASAPADTPVRNAGTTRDPLPLFDEAQRSTKPARSEASA